jgi:hypothetical protein
MRIKPVFYTANSPSVYIHHILINQLPIRALMAPNVINPSKIKMTSAGVVATANLIMRTTIDLFIVFRHFGLLPTPRVTD